MDRRTVVFGFILLIALSAMPVIPPVQVFRKNPPPSLNCSAAFGTDPHGVVYIVHFING